MYRPSSARVAPPRAQTRSLVDDPNYRLFNLSQNGIKLRQPFEALPRALEGLVRDIQYKTSAPLLDEDAIRAEGTLGYLEDRAVESQVEQYFSDAVFLVPRPRDGLHRIDRLPMAVQAVPTTGAQMKVSTPAPDMLYGYHAETAFPDPGHLLVASNLQAAANSARLLYPFLVVEFKGEFGSLWAATNQCIGGMATAVNLAEQLHELLLQRGLQGLPPGMRAVFGATVSGTIGGIFLSWKENGTAPPGPPRPGSVGAWPSSTYYTQRIQAFSLLEPADFVQFHRQVQNILAWGRTVRLQALRAALDRLLAAGWQPPVRPVATQAQSRRSSSSYQSTSVSSGSGKKRRTAN